MSITCPNCGDDLDLVVQAELPKETDLTLALDVAPGQLMRLDTIAGVLSSFRDLQIAVGKSLGGDTEVFLADVSMKDNRFSFTTRIVNAPAQGTEAGTAETGTGSVHDGPVAKPCAEPQSESSHD